MKKQCIWLIATVFVALAVTVAAFYGSSLKKRTSPCELPCIRGEEAIMNQKAHGTSETPVQQNLRWNVDRETADRICNFNRHYAESRGYWLLTNFLSDIQGAEVIIFYDSNTGLPLFQVPQNRSIQDFVEESTHHGWPSFRNQETIWQNVRVLQNGETVSVNGTHLGHNLPDGSGNRYCINLVSIAGNPVVVQRQSNLS